MLKRIPVTQLRLGMFVQSLCGSWLDHPFWKRGGFLLDNQSDLQRLRESAVKEVWIDAGKGLDLPEEAAVSAAAVLPVTMPADPSPARVALEEEIRHAALLCGRAKAAVVSMFHDARMGQAIDTAHASDLVDEISASVLRHPNALVSLVRLKTSDEYTYMHSVAVCALMIALARQLELSDPLVHEAGLAGLPHDIGKMAVPDPILNKPGKLTEQEFGLVRRHPQNGARMLLDCRQVSALVVDVCLHHHERIDGTGYPFGLAQEQISLLARMGTVCDVYDAITSDRPYKKGWNAAEAIRRMAEWNGHFDPQVFRAFVKAVGIYPVGALVRLESGRLGVVLEQHGRSLLTPRVKVFFSARSKVPIPQQVIDLGRAGQTDRIVGFEPAEAWNFRNLDEIWTGLPSNGGSYFDAGTGKP